METSRIDREGPEPVYRQVAAVLRKRIESGVYQPGRPLPSEPHLMSEFEVARETARKAVRVLRDEGLVLIVQGRGAFVTPPAEESRD